MRVSITDTAIRVALGAGVSIQPPIVILEMIMLATSAGCDCIIVAMGTVVMTG
jgi:hypothetical protein